MGPLLPILCLSVQLNIIVFDQGLLHFVNVTVNSDLHSALYCTAKIKNSYNM